MYLIYVLEPQFIYTDEIMVTSDLFLSKEFDIFVNQNILGKGSLFQK